MAYLPLVVARSELAPPRTFQAPRRGLFGRLLDAMVASRQRQVDREIARFLQANGGRLTDNLEREIERRFLWGPSGSLSWRG